MRVRVALRTLAVALALAPGASAEAVRSEGVGTAALPGSPGVSPRAAALEAALRDAVLEVARALVGSATSPTAEAALHEALGPDPTRFVLTYRSVSEREQAGRRDGAAAAGTNGPGQEVTVTVEAQVDRARVAGALRGAGLLAERARAPEDAQRLVLEPIPSWTALTMLRRRLVELGAQQVLLAQVEPGRVVLTIQGGSAERLARAVISAPPPGIWVEATGEHEGAPRLRLEAVAIPPDQIPAQIDTPAEKR